MTAPAPRQGAVYDVGAALAIYWPDTHPCGPNRPQSWLILLPEGDVQWAAELRDEARLLCYLPGFEPAQPQTIANTPPSPVSQAAGPLGIFQPVPDAGYAAGYRHAKEGR